MGDTIVEGGGAGYINEHGAYVFDQGPGPKIIIDPEDPSSLTYDWPEISEPVHEPNPKLHIEGKITSDEQAKRINRRVDMAMAIGMLSIVGGAVVKNKIGHAAFDGLFTSSIIYAGLKAARLGKYRRSKHSQ
jgi:hypothetical protein